MKKTKLKLKKQIWIILIIILIVSISIYSGIKIHQDKVYKASNEYKLLQVGYSLDEIKFLESKLSTERITSLTNKEKDNKLLEILNSTYYLAKNLDSYLTYASTHQNTKTDNVIAIVNTHNDQPYYSLNLKTDLTKDYLIITNKYYQLEKEYIPDDLVNVANTYYYGNNHRTRQIVYDAFKKMWKSANDEGIYLIITSSFRDYAEQQNAYDYYKTYESEEAAEEKAAHAGYSEHQTGLALDIFSKKNPYTSNFKGSVAHSWLQENAYLYGFIERYPENKKEITGFDEEAWHWRYVGVEAAKYIHENNITFDEYYAYFIEK